jgi:MoxR-like ATPase
MSKNKKDLKTEKEEKLPKTISFQNIELEIEEETNQHVPQNAMAFIDHQNILKTIALGVKKKKHVLIIGESGVGKTSAIRYLAQQTNHALRRINLNGGTTADELVGRNGINEKGTYWIDGVLTECLRNGYWLVLDEINAALPEVTFILHSLLDDDGYVVLTEKPDGEIVRPHPNFRVFATCNPASYAGTKEMNTALLSRFHICIFANFPSEEVEKNIVKEHLGATIAMNAATEKVIKLANETRRNKENEKSNYAINTRDIINMLSLCTDYVPTEAIKLAFINKLNHKDKKAFETIAALHLPDRMIKENEVAVMNINEIEINKKFVTIKTTNIRTNTIENVKKLQTIGAQTAKSKKETLEKEENFEIEEYFYENDTKGTTTKKKEKLIGVRIKYLEGKNAGKEAMLTLPGDKEREEFINSILLIKDIK